jgi:hypothetical protein
MARQPQQAFLFVRFSQARARFFPKQRTFAACSYELFESKQKAASNDRSLHGAPFCKWR